MKRDMDLVRKILFAIEGAPYAMLGIDLKLDGYSTEDVQFHLELLDEANLLRMAPESYRSAQELPKPMRLTWEGCEFLDAARNDDIWHKAKQALLPIGGFAFEILKPLLVDLVKQQVGLR